jgi:hypothetical protein
MYNRTDSIFHVNPTPLDYKTTTVGAHRGAYEIKLHESNDVSICYQVSSWLKVVSGIS